MSGIAEAAPVRVAPALIGVRWVLQIIVALILAQTLFFKFTAAPESVYIFSTLGIEPWGRLATAVAELVAVGLLLPPALTRYGALFSIAIISGALFSHLTKLGIVIKDDGGLLFALAVGVFIGSIGIVLIEALRGGTWFGYRLPTRQTEPRP